MPGKGGQFLFENGDLRGTSCATMKPCGWYVLAAVAFTLNGKPANSCATKSGHLCFALDKAIVKQDARTRRESRRFPGNSRPDWKVILNLA